MEIEKYEGEPKQRPWLWVLGGVGLAAVLGVGAVIVIGRKARQALDQLKPMIKNPPAAESGGQIMGLKFRITPRADGRFEAQISPPTGEKRIWSDNKTAFEWVAGKAGTSEGVFYRTSYEIKPYENQFKADILTGQKAGKNSLHPDKNVAFDWIVAEVGAP